MMQKILLIFFLLFLNSVSQASIKKKIIENLNNTQNLSFNFEQNIKNKIETGKCIIKYPKKIFCKYNLSNEKVLVSNGKSLVIKTKNGIYYRYPITNTPLNYILDKDFLIKQIENLSERVIENKFINFTIFKNDNEINLFFDRDNYNLIGWQVLDIYQNINITYISSIKKNKILNKNIFKIPLKN
jgi:outer membrane lipoprotein-sorting protein